ncbi:MAG: DUF2079 domain-containing protein [Chloroflexaceae bacterium]|nr:DUF2079 domain-containing protein [Chloroflexaceae bacterium]
MKQNRLIWALLFGGTLSYALIFAVAAIYKFHSFWMGFDLGVHEQLIWNTMHGRIAAVSPFGNTQSYFGIDIILVEVMLTPLYALLPRTETLLVLQVVLAASGSLPIFLIARDRLGSGWYGLLGALCYLAALPVQHAILYEFQIRTVGTVCFLWAFLFLARRQFWPFVLAALLAIWTRSDAGLALAAMGGYAAIQRYRWPWVITPMVMGLGWLWLCVRVLIPAFRTDDSFQYTFIYGWLGDTPLEMLQTLVLQPGYVASHVLTPEKLWYLLELFGPLLFLPLLRPDILLMALPSLGLNLLSADRIHWSIRYHYQAFVIPFLLIAAIYVIGDCLQRNQRTNSPVDGGKRRWYAKLPIGQGLALLLLLSALGSQLVLRSPLINLATRRVMLSG